MGFIVDKEFIKEIEANVISAITSYNYTLNRHENLVNVEIDPIRISRMVDYHRISSMKLMIAEETSSTIFIVNTDDLGVNSSIGEDIYCAIICNKDIYNKVVDILAI